MYSEENRALKYAIAASIVLHGALLFGVSQRDRARVGESLAALGLGQPSEVSASQDVVLAPTS